jgi:hypothetical protein
MKMKPSGRACLSVVVVVVTCKHPLHSADARERPTARVYSRSSGRSDTCPSSQRHDTSACGVRVRGDGSLAVATRRRRAVSYSVRLAPGRRDERRRRGEKQYRATTDRFPAGTRALSQSQQSCVYMYVCSARLPHWVGAWRSDLSTAGCGYEDNKHLSRVMPRVKSIFSRVALRITYVYGSNVGELVVCVLERYQSRVSIFLIILPRS